MYRVMLTEEQRNFILGAVEDALEARLWAPSYRERLEDLQLKLKVVARGRPCDRHEWED
ncbi:MAG: hypothetical protein IRY99_27590 [Isosphaeraceae bacterium]|nr:hypothetical protein [Isosphaeraceae bacterium]